MFTNVRSLDLCLNIRLMLYASLAGCCRWLNSTIPDVVDSIWRVRSNHAIISTMYLVLCMLQAACIPLALSGRDICGSAMTGSGKTAAFALPILERLLYRPRQVAATYVLILAPARELAVQVGVKLKLSAQCSADRA